ncbi:tRNA adenosine(34) deaminase TadA [Weissella confusa]|uniref:tRNA adenosine(34) deaminase TadA n=1 Tax=Weissella confusa TaxID=1583 RepID=UPI0018F207D9|nr:tRNA adenosine(34) deaminase TadA [Weissella confusa]MBJ7617794.1 nucleoside deaminase [Weissella confusa]MBJ7651150.1 nucleoside deaminase [Weissella confusa]MBJ7656768.1 nucleoside deaminase [Weissella confusa]MBJ7664777.1 nucleoside deaminase [Weissella confusa]
MTTLTPEQVDYFMGEAIKEAKKAGALGEVPIGAVVVQNGQIIGRGFNLRERLEDASQHAELQAITEANRLVKSWRLPDAQLFVTLEPCIMCAGIIQQSRISDVYYGAEDPKAGAVHSLYHILEDERLNHQVNVYQGVREQESGDLLRNFFREIRKQKKAEKKARRAAELAAQELSNEIAEK